MNNRLTLYTPLEPMSALTALCAGRTCRRWQLCSPLQKKSCDAMGYCLKYDKATELAKIDIALCREMEFTANTLERKEKE